MPRDIEWLTVVLGAIIATGYSAAGYFVSAVLTWCQNVLSQLADCLPDSPDALVLPTLVTAGFILFGRYLLLCITWIGLFLWCVPYLVPDHPGWIYALHMEGPDAVFRLPQRPAGNIEKEELEHWWTAAVEEFSVCMQCIFKAPTWCVKVLLNSLIWCLAPALKLLHIDVTTGFGADAGDSPHYTSVAGVPESAHQATPTRAHIAVNQGTSSAMKRGDEQLSGGTMTVYIAASAGTPSAAYTAAYIAGLGTASVKPTQTTTAVSTAASPKKQGASTDALLRHYTLWEAHFSTSDRKIPDRKIPDSPAHRNDVQWDARWGRRRRRPPVAGLPMQRAPADRVRFVASCMAFAQTERELEPPVSTALPTYAPAPLLLTSGETSSAGRDSLPDGGLHLPKPVVMPTPTTTLSPTPAPTHSLTATPSPGVPIHMPAITPAPTSTPSPAVSPAAQHESSPQVMNSLAVHIPAPAPTYNNTSAAAVSLVVRVGLEGQLCWSQTVTASAGMTAAAVWAECAAYLGVEQACCVSAFCNSQIVSAADQTLAAFGSSNTVQLAFVLNPQGSHALHLRMVDANSTSSEAVFLKFEQVDSALQRWAVAVNLPFDNLLFFYGGHPSNALATFRDLAINSGDVVNVMIKDVAMSASTTSSPVTPQCQAAIPPVHLPQNVLAGTSALQGPPVSTTPAAVPATSSAQVQGTSTHTMVSISGLPASDATAAAATAPSNTPSPACPSAPPPASQIPWPTGFKSLTPAPTPTADPNTQQQQQAAGLSNDGDSDDEAGRAKNEAPPKKSRPSLTLDSLLPPGSPFASVPAQSESAATQALVDLAGSSAPGQIMLTITREGHAPISAPGPHTCTVEEAITSWASHAKLQVDALQVSHKGCPLDRQTWDLSFLQLGFGQAEVQLDVKVSEAVAGPSTTPPHDPHASSSSQAGTLPSAPPPASAAAAAVASTTAAPAPATVHVTVNIEGRAPVAGNGPADFKLGDLLAEATGLPVDALQVAHKGCLVDKTKWGCSLAELAWGPQVELSVRADLAPLPAAGQPIIHPTADATLTAAAPTPSTPIPSPATPSNIASVSNPADQGRSGSASSHCVTLRSPKINNGEAFKYTLPPGESDIVISIIKTWIEDYGKASPCASVAAQLESGADLDTEMPLALNDIGPDDVICVVWKDPDDDRWKPRRGRKQTAPKSSAW